MNEAKVYTQEHCTIYGRGVWHYLIDTFIGHIHVVEYEDKQMALQRFLINADNDKAEKKFQQICAKMLKGVL